MPHTLCILQGFIDNQGDAWNWALDYLRRTIDDLALAVDADDAVPDREKEAQAIDGYRSMAAIIGRRLGELHVALASPSDDPAFEPEAATPEQVQAWTEGTLALLASALDLLAQRVDQLTDDTRELARSLLERREALTDAVAKLVPTDAGALRTRIHGDFHLGQVLVAQGDAYLIDFEGEPARSLEERRQKSSPMRDVAGLLRSFSYASAAAQSTTESAPQQTADRKRALFDRFRGYAAESFLSAYRDAVAEAAQPLVAPESEQALLDLFLIEKAAYEIRYEAANRPTWLSLPVRGLAALASRLLGDTGTPTTIHRRPALPAPYRLTRLRAIMSEYDPTAGLQPLDLDALVEARHPDPFSQLGMHQGDAGVEVRALLPNAAHVTVIARADGATLGELQKIHPNGLFVGRVNAAAPYRLRIDWHGHVQEIEDTYSFGPVLGDEPLHRLAHGDPYAVLECLGSRPMEFDGVPGVRFAVWAPNARRVSVVGDFNSWDGRRHPMRLRHQAGVWELFVPRVGPGTRYKYELLARDGHPLPLKADPCAMQTERPPATASVVAHVDEIEQFPWTDDAWIQSRAANQTPRSPISIYEVHAESWLRIAEEGHRSLDWAELADRLIPYAQAWALRTSNSCRSPSIRLAARGVISRWGSLRRRRASANPSSSPSSSTAHTKPGSA